MDSLLKAAQHYEQFSNWMFGYCYDFTADVERTSLTKDYLT